MLSRVLMVGKVAILLWIATWLFGRLVQPEHAKWARERALPMMITFYAAGMLGMNVWIFYLVLVAYIPLAATSRGDAAALFIVALGSIPDVGAGISIGGASFITLDKYVCFALGFGIVFLREPRAGLRFNGRFDLPFLAILAVEFVQARGMNFTSTIRSLLTTVLSVALGYFMLSRAINKAEDMRRFMVAFAYLGFMLGVVAIFESFTRFFVYQQIYGALNVQGAGGLIYKMRGGLLRSVTSFGDATSLSLFLVMGLMATIACRYSFKTTTKLIAALLTIAFGIFVTSSRNAWLATIIGVIAFDFFRRRYFAMAGKVMVLGGAYAVLTLAAEFSPYVSTMMGHSNDTSSTSDYRALLLRRGLEEFWKHPFIGYDTETMMANLRDLTQGEGIIDFVNGYVFYGLVAGYSGIIALLIAFLGPAWAMMTSRKALMRHPYTLERYGAFVFAVSLTALITTGLGGFGGRGASFYYMILATASTLYAWRTVPFPLLAASDRDGPGTKGRMMPVVSDKMIQPLEVTPERRKGRPIPLLSAPMLNPPRFDPQRGQDEWGTT